MNNIIKPAGRALLILILGTSLGGCLGIPENMEPVQDFELDRYLGTWYEIARMDHSFERGLSSVSAQYSQREGETGNRSRGCPGALGTSREAGLGHRQSRSRS